jgi:hypothetical protein
VRVILLDLSGGRTVAIAIFQGGPSGATSLDPMAADAMPIIDTFELTRPTP